MNNLINKMNLQKDIEELKLYMFTVQSGPIKIDLPEDFKAIMAYNDAEALNIIRKDYAINHQLFIKKRAQVEVKKIIDVVNLQIPQDFKIQVVPPEPREKTATDFIYNMMFIADKFVTNKRDQASLKRIISKIKINEDQTIIESKENLA